MRISLRVRVLLLVAAVNVAIFGAGLYVLTRTLAVERQGTARENTELIALFVSTYVVSRTGELRVPQLLRNPNWERVTDAVLVSNVEPDVTGRYRARGVFLNPLGSVHRAPGFDLDAILERAAQAIRLGVLVEGPLGICVPIRDESSAVWGACWFDVETDVDAGAVFLQLLPWFLASTLLLTLGTFSVLRRFVLDPVRALADGSRRVRAGELSVPVPAPRTRDELSDLVSGFNEMTVQVLAFQERLEEEAERARQQARSAEAAAIRQRQLAAMGELAAGIAHEINNPLGGLLNAVDTLGRPDLKDERRARYLALLQDGLERIQGTVSKLLRFTPREAERQPLALADPVADAVALARHRADAQGVRLELEADPEALVEGLRGELGQAVLNLIVNALDALEGRAGGRVDVAVARRRDEVLLTVADDGPGVGPEELERVGDLFYTTKDVGKGTGLGLALVNDVVHRHDGRVRFESQPGAGFRVEIALPAWRGRDA